MNNETRKKAEEWSQIIGYEGHYEVSNLGRIKSLKNNKCKILKPGGSSDGYLVVVLIKDGVRKTKRVHRIVAENLLERCYNKKEVNHRNQNKMDNSLHNLEWCTRVENMRYADIKERISRSLTNNKYTSKRIIQYSNSNDLIKEWPSFSEACRNGYSYNMIRKSINNNELYAGFFWRLK